MQKFLKDVALGAIIASGVQMAGGSALAASVEADGAQTAAEPGVADATPAATPPSASHGGANQGANVNEPTPSQILEILVAKRLISRAEADAIVDEARAKAASADTVVRVPYIPDNVMAKIRDEARQDVVETAKAERWGIPGGVPDWISRVTIDGDVRVRQEATLFASNNVPYPDFRAINARSNVNAVFGAAPVLNNFEDRHRTRVRARVGVGADLGAGFDAKVRFVTGAESDPISTNETFSGNFSKNELQIDQAFVRFRPLDELTLFAGKFDNPFLSTDMIFDTDLTFDGFAAKASYDFQDVIGAPVEIFASGGYFPLEEYDFQKEDKFLLAGQTGLKVDLGNVSAQLAGAYYNYNNVTGVLNRPAGTDKDFTAPSFFQRGNSLFNIRVPADASNPNDPGNVLRFAYASEFEVAAATARLDIKLHGPIGARLEGEFARNTAFDENSPNFFVGNEDVAPNFAQEPTGRDAWLLRGIVGHAKLDQPWAWSVAASYRSLESDSVLDAFTDSDFGGTSQEGYVIQTGLALTNRVALGATWLSVRSIDITGIEVDVNNVPVIPFAAREGKFDFDTIQLDLNIRF